MNDLPGDVFQAMAESLSRAEPPAITVTELVLAVLVAAALSIPHRSWRYFGLLATVVHELGHAFAAVTSGQRLSGIRLRFDHSGTTTTYSRSRAAAAWSCFWGYPVPAVVGAVFVACGFNGWGPAAFGGSVLVLAASLLFLRNLAGFAITALAIAGTLALILLVPGEFVGHAAVILGLALLVAAVRDVIKLAHVHLYRRERLATSDAYLLYRATAVPSVVWIVLFAAFVTGSWVVALQPVSTILARGV
ncbi:M50 family metallopeptidase [Pseudarthrobacter sp. NamE2]|uniref:M50 family metallopeptidase n=1 Tax=Pseudarthrobacter sp. NamE2 TaxID=2576838 RepID=UPI0010FF43BD|nr:M50 family metallopeptidase [Pseudarthrobacter sp. NamE2]TLM86723.1 M50 family metallopeptidase [Pseudarthrobacter sp. NamE2]